MGSGAEPKRDAPSLQAASKGGLLDEVEPLRPKGWSAVWLEGGGGELAVFITKENPYTSAETASALVWCNQVLDYPNPDVEYSKRSLIHKSD